MAFIFLLQLEAEWSAVNEKAMKKPPEKCILLIVGFQKAICILHVQHILIKKRGGGYLFIYLFEIQSCRHKERQREKEYDILSHLLPEWPL